MIKLPIGLLSAMFLPISVATPEPKEIETMPDIQSIDTQYPSLPLTPLSPWS